MSAQTGISWCDSTHNAWLGCTKVSPACDHCYAERDMDTRLGKVRWGAGQPRVRTSEKNRNLPIRWNRLPFVECMHCGWRGEQRASGVRMNPPGFHPPVASARVCPACDQPMLKEARRRVFSLSLGDWLDNEVPIEWLVDLLDLIRRMPNLDWLLLSKRIGNWRTRLGAALNASNSIELREWIALWLNGDAPHNVWMLATVVTQDEADRDVPKLLRVPARVRGLSIEPMLSAVRVTRWTPTTGLDWIIVGGESGPHARPMHPDWVRSLRDQAQAAGVAFHFKQWGEWLPQVQFTTSEQDDRASGRGCDIVKLDEDRLSHRVGKKLAGRELDGATHNGFPR